MHMGVCVLVQVKQFMSAVGTQLPMGTVLRRMEVLLTEITLSTKEVQSFLLGNILKLQWCAFHSGALLIFRVLPRAGLLNNVQ